jgi:hypothetical protein
MGGFLLCLFIVVAHISADEFRFFSDGLPRTNFLCRPVDQVRCVSDFGP